MIALLLLQAALAAPPTTITPERTHDTEALIADLLDGIPKEQTYAARELRRRSRLAVGDLDNSNDIRRAEARLLLEKLDTQAAPACTTALAVRHVAGLCADVLRTLETTDALPALRALEPDTRGVTRRKVQRAVAFLESL